VTPDQRKRSKVALAVVLSVGFAILAHAALVDRVPPAVGAVLSIIPLTLLAAWGLRRAHSRTAAVAALVLAVVAAWLGWPLLERHFPSVFFIEHAGTNLLLAVLFGRTLRPGAEPLVARFARIVHGTIPAEVERYTRQVTLAWTVFFATLFALSCALYLGNFLAEWSLLANILSPILVCAMFVGEYAVRLRALPNWEQVGIFGGIRAFTRHFGTARFEAPR
jgi:uncharacterized membrane protein